MAIIAIDFDGTCVTHDYPEVGKDIGAIPVLRALRENGHHLILNTMRDSQELEDAKMWFAHNGITLFGANCNPTQSGWTTSPKVYAQVYIDDAALGCPLKFEPSFSNRPFVDWREVTKYLTARGLLTQDQLNTLLKQ